MHKDPLEPIWPAMPPPDGFAERVLGALEAEKAPGAGARAWSGRRLWAVGALGAALGAAAVAGVLRTGSEPGGRSGAASGHVLAGVRQTVSIGTRATAVLEEGSEIAWSTEAGRMRIEQPRGSVFYRVDRGGAFVVATPAGEVHVAGTCFRVLTEPRDDGGTSALVELLEGSVTLRNRLGTLALAVGERARLRLGEPPAKVQAPEASLHTEAGGFADDSLGGGGQRSDRERALTAEARLREAERALAEARSGGGGRGQRKFFDFTPEERREMGRRCEYRYDLPRHLTALDSPNIDESLVLDGGERASVLRLMNEQRTAYVESLRTLYLEVTGDRSAAYLLSPKALQEDLFAKVKPDELEEARRRLFDEWEHGAGAAPRGAESHADRLLRILLGAGDTFYRRVSQVVGTERAREIRKAVTSDMVVYGPKCDAAKPAAEPGR